MATPTQEPDWWAFTFEGPHEKVAHLNELLEIVKGKAKAFVTARLAAEAARQKGRSTARQDEIELKAEIRKTYEEGILKATALACDLERDDHEHNIQDWVIRARSFVDHLDNLRTAITKQNELLHELENREDPEARRLANEFNVAIEKLSDACTAAKVTLPWQIRFKLLLVPRETQVELYGGAVTTPDGKRINESRCALTGMLIQHWAEGEGTLRYHSLDTDVDHTQASHEAVMKVYALARQLSQRTDSPALASAGSEVQALLRSRLSPHLDGLWALENNIGTFLRFPIVDAPNVATMINAALRVYAGRALFGTRTPLAGGGCSEYRWTTYDEVREQALRLAWGLRAHPQLALPEGAFVGIAMRNRPEWLLADIACALNWFVSVGIITTWPREEVVYVVNNAVISVIICDPPMARVFREVFVECSSLKRIVVVDYDTATDLHGDERFVSYASVVSTPDPAGEYAGYSGVGMSTAASGPPKPCKRNPEAIHSLIYSSGTTGEPKGIIETEQRWKSQLSAPVNATPLVVMSYSPLAHGMDRGMAWTAIANGGRVAFVSDSHRLLDDARFAEPTLFVAMPYVWTALYADFEERLVGRLKAASSQPVDAEQVRREVIAEYRGVLGRRLRHVATGGAPLSDQVFSFMKEVFATDSCQVVNNYGTTEVPGIAQDGIVAAGIQLELRDVPEMGYYAKDKKGEICVRAPSRITPGYYKNPQRTAESFDERGFFHTGDIGMLDEQGHLHIIDRKKNLIELYVAGRSMWIPSGELEAKFLSASSAWIDQIFIYGERTEAYCIAVIVPHRKTLEHWAAERAIPMDSLVGLYANKNHELTHTLTEELSAVGRRLQLQDYEIPRGVVVDSHRWTIEDGRLSASGKSCRPKLLKYYRLAIDLEYNRLSKQDGAGH